MKLTRKSYKRKIVVFGVMMVLAISLISTGFAAWIISQGTEQSADGNVEVGLVEDKSVKITDLKFYADCYEPDKKELSQKTAITFEELTTKPLKFAFDPVYEDATGNVKFDQEAYDKAEASKTGSGTGFEALKIRVTGTIEHAKMLSEIKISFKVPEEIKTAETKNFIVLPDYSSTDGVATHTLAGNEIDLSNVETADTATFDFTVEIKWGTAFNSKNPSEYFDSVDFTEPEGVGEGYNKIDEIKVALDELKGVIYGLTSKKDTIFGNRTYGTYDRAELEGATTAPKFKLTINAIAQ